MQYNEYEVRNAGKYYQVVHIRTGHVVEDHVKYKSFADALCKRFNQCL